MSLGLAGWTATSTLRSELTFEVRTILGNGIDRLLDLDGETSEPATEARVVARVVSGPRSVDIITVTGVPLDGLVEGTRGVAHLTRARRADYGPVQFPSDFGPSFLMGFLGLGFGAYAAQRRRRRA
ncbi:hypothetical protein [Gymnodinialimonas sp.]